MCVPQCMMFKMTPVVTAAMLQAARELAAQAELE